VAGELAQSFEVVAYDRRGHGLSRAGGHGTRRDQEDDLAALIEALGRGPVHVAGTSFGASIALGLAGRRPELVRSVVAHEPPLMSLVAGDPEIEPLMAGVAGTVAAVLALIDRGELIAAAELFVEKVALGPGAWEQLPAPLRATMIESAPAFAAEQSDPWWAVADPRALARTAAPVLVTQGDSSPPWFPAIVAALVDAIDGAELQTYDGAGHAPHISHPGDYVRVVSAFLSGNLHPSNSGHVLA
jgi:pimeloyl-ACP methyl ester carboxylesterase